MTPLPDSTYHELVEIILAIAERLPESALRELLAKARRRAS